MDLKLIRLPVICISVFIFFLLGLYLLPPKNAFASVTGDGGGGCGACEQIVESTIQSCSWVCDDPITEDYPCGTEEKCYYYDIREEWVCDEVDKYCSRQTGCYHNSRVCDGYDTVYNCEHIPGCGETLPTNPPPPQPTRHPDNTLCYDGSHSWDYIDGLCPPAPSPRACNAGDCAPFCKACTGTYPACNCRIPDPTPTPSIIPVPTTCEGNYIQSFGKFFGLGEDIRVCLVPTSAPAVPKPICPSGASCILFCLENMEELKDVSNCSFFRKCCVPNNLLKSLTPTPIPTPTSMMLPTLVTLPTALPTATPVPPTATPLPTATPVPPTATPTSIVIIIPTPVPTY